MRGRLASALAFLMLLSAGFAFAQKHPNIELGFKADKLYQFNDLDAVNLFNGNLTLSIPLGLRYPVGPSLSYQFVLSYNSNVWDYRQEQDGVGNIYREGKPNIRSNAGMGWRLSFGRLIQPGDSTAEFWASEDTNWVYESPAGDEHSFGRTTVDVTATSDGSTLRLVKISGTQRNVEFSSGEVHEFVLEQSHYRLKKMRDRFGNWMAISYTYDSSGAPSTWTITDSEGRQHVVFFDRYLVADDSFDRGAQAATIRMATAAGNETATYSLAYDSHAVSYGCGHQPRPPELGGPEGSTVIVPLLSTVILPDSSYFAFQYDEDAIGCDTAALKQWTLPTGGAIAYQYTQYALASGDGCNYVPVISQPVGISKKTTIDGVTDYVQRLGPGVILQYDGYPCGTGPDVAGIIAPSRWSRTSVLSPVVTVDGQQSRTRTDSYFNSWITAPGASTDRLAVADGLGPYGLPTVAGAPSLEESKAPFASPWDAGPDDDESGKDDLSEPVDPASPPRFLSTRVMGGCAPDISGACSAVLRSTYRRYDITSLSSLPTYPVPQAGAVYSPSSQRVVYHDDPGCGSVPCFIQSTSSDWDNVSHYRTTITSSNFPGEGSATSTIHYPGIANGASAQTPWLTNLYDETLRSEGGVTERAFACFDSSTGFLKRSRTLAGAAPSSKDVVTTYTSDPWGNVASEKSYGGDLQALPVPANATADCTLPLVGANQVPLKPQFSSIYDYTAGVMKLAQYLDPQTGNPLPFKTIDRTVVQATGLVTRVRDSASLETEYRYDNLPGRLTDVIPPAGAGTSYVYTRAAGGAPAKVDITAVGGGSIGSVRSQVQFDGQGRVVREANLMPDAKWSVVQSRYDSLGQKADTSEPQSFTTIPTASFVPSALTTFVYDSFGRPTKVTSSDGSVSWTGYTGARTVARTACVATGGTDSGCIGGSLGQNQERVTTTETYDSRGRLSKVEEPQGGSVASYGYDTGGRLATVDMTAAGTTQQRRFVFDGRGFLITETHPEKGPAGNGTVYYYNYDSHGHAIRKVDGSLTSPSDLTFTFDAAERLVTVAETSGNVIKSIVYASANDIPNLNWKLGKVESATRHNHITNSSGSDTDVAVTETYDYSDPAGRVKAKTTSVVNGASTIQTFRQVYDYDNLAEIATVTYPNCGLSNCPGLPSGLVTSNYLNGRLIGVAGYGSIDYHPNGLVHNVQHLTAASATTPGKDVQEVADSNGIVLQRPSGISFTGLTTCANPAPVVTAPGSLCAGASGSASVNAESGATYSWTISGGMLGGTTGSSVTFTAGSTGTVTLTVVGTNSCGSTTVSGSTTITASTSIVSQPFGQSISVGQQAVLQVSATGAGLSYQWYRGASGDVSNPLAGSTQASCTVTPTVTTSCWVRVSGSCGIVSSSTATIVVASPLPGATGLSATTQANTSVVRIEWTAVANASSYRVSRRTTLNGSPAWLSPVSGQTFTTDTLSPNVNPTAYVYVVYAIDQYGNESSNPSNADYAVVATSLFTDEPLHAPTDPGGGTSIAGRHVQELRKAIDAVRVSAGLNQIWATTPAPTGAVLAADYTSLKAPLDAARAKFSIGPFNWSGVPAPAASGLIWRAHVQQVRDALR
jgi:YD repeat-containing protein